MVEGLPAARCCGWRSLSGRAGAGRRAAAGARDAGGRCWSRGAGLGAAVLGPGSRSSASPGRWPELARASPAGWSLGAVRLPYAGADPWPALVSARRRAAARRCRAAGLLAGARGARLPVPGARRAARARGHAGGLDRRHPAAGARRGARRADRRLPVARAVAAAAGGRRGRAARLAVAGSLPLAAVADRGEPWFDYRAFAEGLGPHEPIRFGWNQALRADHWPRNGTEVLRVASDEPRYWKVANLEEFDGSGWNEATPHRGGDAPRPRCSRTGATAGLDDELEVSIRRLRTRDVPARARSGGRRSTRPLRASGVPGRYGRDRAAARRLLHGRGPRSRGRRPRAGQADEGLRGERADDLR